MNEARTELEDRFAAAAKDYCRSWLSGDELASRVTMVKAYQALRDLVGTST